MLVSKVTSRCLLMVIWAQPHSLMWLGPIGVHVHMYVKLLLGSSVPSIGFLKKTYMVMNSNLMTTIVSIASVRWLAVVVFSLGRNSLYAYTLRERLTFRWTLLDWKFSWNKQNSLLTCKHVCSWFLAWRLWHCPVALSYTVTRISCIKGTLLRKSLHDNFAFHSQVVGGSIQSINWQFWLQFCRPNEEVLSVIDEPRKSFAQESHHPVVSIQISRWVAQTKCVYSLVVFWSFRFGCPVSFHLQPKQLFLT